MKDEIKEINITFPGQILDYVDTKEHLLDLFNHITNLQEENKKLLKKSYSDDVRITKAIEYVKRVCESEKNINPYILHAPTLLNILQGDDK